MQFVTRNLTLVKTLLTSVMVFLLAACGTTEVQPSDNDVVVADAFVGAVDADLFIGAVIAEHPAEEFQHAQAIVQKTVVVYLCDGEDVSAWLVGETAGESVVLEGGDMRVELTFNGNSVSGEVERADGAPQAFTASLATGEAGIYRAEETFDATDYVGGWIVLNDGRQQGAVTVDGQVMENPTLNVATGQAEASVGTFSADRRICITLPGGIRVCAIF
jgi:hypothetical protein